jgi:hypothetical protein
LKYVYLVVEGPHDVAVIGRILDMNNIKLIKQINDLDEFWDDKRLIPHDFPIEGDLLKRVPIPTFYQSDEVSVAIHSAGGDSKINKTLQLTLANLDVEDLSAFAIFRDADNRPLTSLFNSMISELKDIPIIANVTNPGEINLETGIKAGIFLFPDNSRNGTLETTLLESATISYSSLLTSATNYVDNADSIYKASWGQSDRDKIIVGCIANILKPGKANQVSIQDNKWICTETTIIDSVKKLKEFIEQLID